MNDVELVVVPLEPEFDSETLERKRARYSELEAGARRAGLKGQVVAVWQDAEGRTRFLAPPEQHAFFRVVNYNQWQAQVNRTLDC
jgi:hypothetical protein